MIKLGIISDLHLGYKQYGLNDRFEDFINAFQRNIDCIIDEEPDILIIAGDIFDQANPDNRSRLVFKEALDSLISKNITLCCINGNHDIINRKSFVSPLKMYEADGLKLLDGNPVIVNDTYICGIDSHSKSKIGDLINRVEKLNEEASGYDNAVLVLHQGFEHNFAMNAELKMSDLNISNFDYVISGHIHNRLIKDFNGTVFISPGSTECHTRAEFSDYKFKGKGYTIVNFDDAEEPDKFVNIPINRAFISKVCDYSKLDRVLEIIEKECDEAVNLPIVNLKVSGGSFTKSDLLYYIENRLNDKCLRLNTELLPDSVLEVNQGNTGGKVGKDAIIGDIRDKLSDYPVELQDFAVSLHEMLLKDKDAAIDLCDSFYEDVFKKRDDE